MNKLAAVSIALFASACLLRTSGSSSMMTPSSTASSPAATPAAAPAPREVTPPAPAAPKYEPAALVASKAKNAAAATALPSNGPVYIAATLPSSVEELLATRGTCRADAKRWVWYHVEVNGAVPLKDARKSGFHSDLLDSEEAKKTESIGAVLVAKKKEAGPTLGYSFADKVAPMLVKGENKLSLWVTATCSPSDVLADEVKIELARGELVINH